MPSSRKYGKVFCYIQKLQSSSSNLNHNVFYETVGRIYVLDIFAKITKHVNFLYQTLRVDNFFFMSWVFLRLFSPYFSVTLKQAFEMSVDIDR